MKMSSSIWLRANITAHKHGWKQETAGNRRNEAVPHQKNNDKGRLCKQPITPIYVVNDGDP